MKDDLNMHDETIFFPPTLGSISRGVLAYRVA
jgi:hypothetical protein